MVRLWDCLVYAIGIAGSFLRGESGSWIGLDWIGVFSS